MDSNHRPHAYQACALTGWAIGPCRVSIGFSFLFPLISIFRVLNVHAFTCTFKDKQYKFCLWRYFYRSTLGILTKLFAQSVLLRKEVIQPHLPIRLPCYDFTPIINPTFDCCLLKGWLTGFGCYRLSWCDGRCVQGPGTYSPRHSDPRLLAIPTSCRRVAACNLNWDSF